MAIQNQPGFIPAPFANSGTKNVIPETLPTPSASAAASWTDGFPTVCSLPLASGGIPPARADFNGLFNSITQAQAFYQSGGVYEWDATIDYGPNRLILGSDGKLYWSVAQSGPNTGAGAVDPTADTAHTYWSTMPMLTPPLGDDSSKAATTEWTRDLAVAPVYVSPSGSDSNDGLSASTPKQTLQGAYNLAVALPRSGEGAVIKMAAGSYTGGLTVTNEAKIALELQGSVSVTGNIAVTKSSSLLITGSSYTFTLTGGTSTQSNVLNIENTSRVNVMCPLTITNSSISITGASNLESISTISCTTANTDNAIQVHGLSNLTCTDLSLNVGTVSNYALHIDSMSYVWVDSLTVSGSSCGGGVFCGANSLFYCSGDLSVGNILTQYPGIECLYGSTTIVFGNTTIQSANSSSVPCIRHYSGSVGIFYGNVALSTTVKIVGFLVVKNQSLCVLDGNITLNGTVWDVSVSCVGNSLLSISSSVTVTGSVTGTRYYAGLGGQILVYGAGASRIPGSIAGVTDASSFGYYG